jgi:hypothetical protein
MHTGHLLEPHEAWSEPANWPEYWTEIPWLAREFFLSLQTITTSVHTVGTKLQPQHEDLPCRYCFILALFEELARPRGAENSPLWRLPGNATLGDLLELSDPRWVADLRQMSYAFHDRHASLLGLPAVLNPGLGRTDLGIGADADIISGPRVFAVDGA